MPEGNEAILGQVLRRRGGRALRHGALLVAVLVTSSVAVAGFVSVAFQMSLSAVLSELVRPLTGGTSGGGEYLGSLISLAAPLWLTALAFSIPLRAGFFNIGAEGQSLVGGLGAAVVALVGVQVMPGDGVVVVGAALVAGVLAGVGWAMVAYWSSRLTGASEVIVTLILNFAASALVLSLLKATRLADPAVQGVQSLPFAESITLPAWRGTRSAPVTWLVGVFVLLLPLVDFWLWQSRVALRMKAAGSNREGALAMRISRHGHVMLAAAIGGGLAGLAGLNTVLGSGHFAASSLFGVGFGGIVVAILGDHRGFGILVAGLAIGAWRLSNTGLQILGAPHEVAQFAEALLLVLVLLGRRWLP